MNIKIITFIIFILSLICLITDMNLFYNLAIFVDEFNTSPDIVYGGDFWLLMNWVKLGLTALIILLSGISLFKIKALLDFIVGK
ncbi:hypothetical protein GMA43_07445 [Turicibacter sanguinis]|nr:hypothetical protein [Turicibacter sanguinis]MTH09577.1 hypothetical protein [Turicibacter sanguinis]MTH12252.1 hypothetical protein [Turicibacter sanguinis]MTH20443.1 hypothetical protein [Turicibacter sanguinis]MTH40315.1 hypothetical protein [Turicibacter sanguinis]